MSEGARPRPGAPAGRSSGLGWKWILILAVIAAAVIAAVPPQERINLGLDLRGGAHIVLEVDPGSALEHQLGLTRDRLGQRLQDLGVRYDSIVSVGHDSLEVRGADPARSSDVTSAIRDVVGETWTVEATGAGAWRLTIRPDYRGQIEASAIQTTLEIMRTRIDSLGVREPQIGQQGANRILVQLPGVEDPERVKGLIEDPARLQWKTVSYPPGVSQDASYRPGRTPEETVAQFGGKLPDDTELIPQRLEDGTALYWPLKKVSVVIGDDLRNAYRGRDEWGRPQVNFELKQEAGKRFEVVTRENMGKLMPIVLGTAEAKTVISAPRINGVIRDQGVIEGGFTVESAEDLALKLKSGAIPTDVRIMNEMVVGPSLGRDSIRAGLTAGLVGFGAVLLFMVFYYRLSGVNAVIALTLNIVLVFGGLGALPYLMGAEATLTLPGIAGLILTIGMAVDSNVLIFERIREELQKGMTVPSAVEAGFSRAFMTILDCNVTTLVAAFFLFFYGTGPVKGFAITLTIGLLASMFTAVFVSRQIFELILQRQRRRHGTAHTLSI